MKYNKGFIGVGLILAIVLGIVVVGGGAYYLGSSKKVVNNPENVLPNNQNQNIEQIDNSQSPAVESSSTVTTTVTPQVATGCTSTSAPSIKVLSPNGGEVFTLGQTINIKWNSKCIDSKALVYLNIGIKDSQAVSELLDGLKVSNTGSYNFTIPSNYNVGGNKSNKYEVGLSYIYGNGEQASDRSDNSFTINSSTVSTANWKMYTDTEYGFSFQYPNTWSLNGQPSNSMNLKGEVVAHEINFFANTTPSTTLLVSYHLPPNGSELYNYAVSEFNSKDGWYKTGSKEIQVVGGNAIEAFTTMSVDGKGNKINPPLRLILVDFLDKQKTGSIQLQFKTPLPNEGIELPNFEKLLTTFKFN